MSKGPSTFRQTDVKRAIRAAESAGKKVDRVEIDRDGKIVVLFPDNGETNTDDNAEVKL
jgi:hypothetical protein